MVAKCEVDWAMTGVDCLNSLVELISKSRCDVGLVVSKSSFTNRLTGVSKQLDGDFVARVEEHEFFTKKLTLVNNYSKFLTGFFRCCDSLTAAIKISSSRLSGCNGVPVTEENWKV